MKLAVSFPAIDGVDAFRSPMIPLAGLGADRLATQRDLVGLQNLPVVHQLHNSVFLMHTMRSAIRGAVSEAPTALRSMTDTQSADNGATRTDRVR